MYKFIKEQDKTNHFDNTRIEVQCDAVSLPDILEAFEYFLKGCGFEFKGNVDIIPIEEDDVQ